MKKLTDILLMGLFFFIAGFIYIIQWIKNPGMNKIESCNRCGRLRKNWKYCKRCGTEYRKSEAKKRK